MKTKYFVAHDGNRIGLFDSLREAEKSAVPHVCEVQFYWPECGCVATVGGKSTCAMPSVLI